MNIQKKCLNVILCVLLGFLAMVVRDSLAACSEYVTLTFTNRTSTPVDISYLHGPNVTARIEAGSIPINPGSSISYKIRFSTPNSYDTILMSLTRVIPETRYPLNVEFGYMSSPPQCRWSWSQQDGAGNSHLRLENAGGDSGNFTFNYTIVEK